jgi:hypothetical protein
MKKSICKHPFVLSLKNNRGEFGIKQLAWTVAVVVIIGIIVQFMSGGWLTARVQDVWTWLWEDVIQNWLS